jgi:hypothetical protein
MGWSNGLQNTILGHTLELQSFSSPTTLGVYEYAAGYLYQGPSSDVNLIERQSYAAGFAPSIYKTILGYQTIMQEAGIQECCYYDLAEVFNSEQAGSRYGVAWGISMKGGIGDGSDSLHDNRPDIAGNPIPVPALTSLVSPTVGAIQAWQSNTGLSRFNPFLSSVFTSPVFVVSV